MNMKKFRTIIITCLAMFWPISMFAQDISEQVNIKEYDFSGFNVNGLEIGDYNKLYSEQDIIVAFGQPYSISFDPGLGYLYDFGEDISEDKTDTQGILKNGRIHTVGLSFLCGYFNDDSCGPIPAIDIWDRNSCIVNGFIRVGDNVDKVKQMGGRCIEYDYGDSSRFAGELIWCPSGWGNADWIVCPKFYFDSNRKIVLISIWVY